MEISTGRPLPTVDMDQGNSSMIGYTDSYMMTIMMYEAIKSRYGKADVTAHSATVLLYIRLYYIIIYYIMIYIYSIIIFRYKCMCCYTLCCI